MAAKKAKEIMRPATRLYLVTPELSDGAAFAATIGPFLGEFDIAAVLARLAPADERSMISHLKTMAPVAQNAGAALLVDHHFQLIARAGADGANVSGVEAMQDAAPTLKPGRILGVGQLHTRHDAMTAGEAGADYVLFGEPNEDGERPSAEAIRERVQWWAEVFEPPCVAYAATLDEARLFTRAGADFIMVGDLVWSDPRGPHAALKDVADIIKDHSSQTQDQDA